MVDAKLDPDEAKRLPRKEPDFPELERRRRFDREEHVKRGMAAGLSREEAEKHADEDLRDRAGDLP